MIPRLILLLVLWQGLLVRAQFDEDYDGDFDDKKDVPLPREKDLACYTGVQDFENVVQVNNVTVLPCAASENCCYMMSSLNGTNYGCQAKCPPKLKTFLCGPDPTSELQDIYYCYCRNSQDPNCQPSFLKMRGRRSALAPAPPASAFESTRPVI